MTRSRTPRSLSHLQAQVLGCVVANGPCDSFAIDYNLRCGIDRARGVARRLEERGLLGRDYTSRRYKGRFGYVATNAGAQEADKLFGDDEEEAWYAWSE